MTTFTTQDRQDAQREPVAWYARNRENGVGYVQTDKPTRMDKVANEYIPLYQTTTPLTDNQIGQIYMSLLPNSGDPLLFARAIERAHGIGE